MRFGALQVIGAPLAAALLAMDDFLGLEGWQVQTLQAGELTELPHAMRLLNLDS